MKQKNRLLLFFSWGALIFQTTICSELENESLTITSGSISFFDIPEKSQDMDFDAINELLQKKENDTPLLIESINEYRNTELSTIKKNHGIQALENEQKAQYNSIFSSASGLTLAGVSLYASKMAEEALKKNNRIFVIDDLIAASAAQNIIQTVIPTIFSVGLAYGIWRQIDYYLHAEDRAQFTLLEGRFKSAVEEVTRNVTKKIEAHDKERRNDSLKIHAFIDRELTKIQKRLEDEVRESRQINLRQDELLASTANESRIHNTEVAAHMQEKEAQVRAIIEDLALKTRRSEQQLTEFHATILSLKDNHKELISKVVSMIPLVENIYTKMQTDPYEELSHIYIPSDMQDEEHKEDPQYTLFQIGQPQPAKVGLGLGKTKGLNPLNTALTTPTSRSSAPSSLPAGTARLHTPSASANTSSTLSSTIVQPAALTSPRALTVAPKTKNNNPLHWFFGK